MIMVKAKYKKIPISKDPSEIQIQQLEAITDRLIRDEDKKILQCKDLASLNRPFITKNHFRDIYGRPYIVAFKLKPDKSGEDIDDFTIFYGIDEDASEQRELSKEGDFFVDKSGMEYFEGDDGYWKIDYKNDPTTGTLGYVHPGYTKIFLKKKNHNNLYDHERLLLALPSSVGIKQLEAMVKEIMYIRRELTTIEKDLIKDAKAYFGLENEDTTEINWEMQLKWIKNCLVQIEPYLKRINNLPKRNLKMVKDEKSYHRIRKITPSIIEQYLQDYSRRKYFADVARNSVDIFEHRLLKCKLLELKKFVELQNAQKKLNSDEEKTAIVTKMAQLVDKDFNFTSGIKFEDIKTKWEEYTSKIEKEIDNDKDRAKSLFDEAFVNYEQVNNPVLNNDVITGINLKLREVDNPRLWFDKGNLVIGITCKNNFKKKEYSLCYDSDNNTGRLIKEIVFRSRNSCELLAFYEEMSRYSAGYDCKTNSILTVRLEGMFFYKADLMHIVLYKIDKMVIGEKGIVFSNDEKKSESRLRDIYAEQSFYNNLYIDNRVGDKKRAEGLESDLNRISLGQNLDYYSKFVLKKIDEFLKLPMFGSVQNKKFETWHLTQIFTNDYNYHQVYRRLYMLDKVCDFSFSEKGEKILLEKIDKLYEYWILIKILEHLLIHQNWVSTNGERDVSEVFNSIFSSNVKDKNFPKVCLKHIGDSCHGNLILELYYNTELESSIRDLFKPGAYRSRKRTPDYLFRVKNERTGDEKIFILDAKYRKYSEMKDNYWIDKDLNGICAQKYMGWLERDLGVKQIAAAFIVHSDMTDGNKMNNTNKFLGRYVTFNAFANKMVGIPIMDGRDGSQCQIGSFYLTPYVNNEFNQSDDNLNMYFEMMFEYFMEEWKTCWRCGSNSVEVKTLYTIRGYPKYHMTCNKCNSFWVKNHDQCGKTIIKHPVNYHIEKDYGLTWDLECPSCKSRLLAIEIRVKNNNIKGLSGRQ